MIIYYNTLNFKGESFNKQNAMKLVKMLYHEADKHKKNN